jgi:uncharacterized phage protein (TIGR01671 family)
MREIRFRAWDNQAKAMSNPFYPLKGERAEIFGGGVYEPDTYYMQYAGLKDKNGKEIYEGDIITRTKVNGEFVHNTKVRWSDASAGFVVETLEPKEFEGELHTLTYPLNGGLSRIGAIIGNIYENPELLKS